MSARKFTAAALAAAAIFGASQASAATIVNGSFEDGAVNPNDFANNFVTLPGGSTAINGWTVGGNSVDYIGDYWQAQDGGRSIDLAGSGDGSIAQQFATVAGKPYIVTFYVGRNPDGGINDRTGFVDVGGLQTQVTYTGSGNRANMQWQKESYQFQALTGSTTLRFSSDPSTSGQFFGMALDNVSISAVPEASTWALMIVGIGLAGGALRRRKAVGGKLALA